LKIRYLNRIRELNRSMNHKATSIELLNKSKVPLRGLWPGMLLVTVFSFVMWRLALLTGRTVIHGDMICFGLPMFDLGGQIYLGDASPFWSAGMYGGHPLFAEGQGAFVNPLTILVDLIVTPLAGPIFAMNFFQFLSSLMAAVGVFGLCRQLKFGALACTFAALAVIFSPIWIFWVDHNPELAGTLLWVPWCLWSLEAWLQKPDARSTVFLGLTCTAMFLAGYTPTVHAIVLYMLIRLVAEPLDGLVRRDWMRTWPRRLMTGMIAVIICVGLTAIQWLPLLELVSQSHRSGGVGLVLQHDDMMFLRGIFYEHPRQFDVVSIGSPLICGLALLAVFGVRSPRMIGHMLAAFVLIQLGFGNGSALFRFVYAHNFLPGLHYLRTDFHFTAIGVIGAIVVCASTIDSLTLWNSTHTRIQRCAVLACVLAICGWGAVALYASNASLIQLAIACVAAVAVAIPALKHTRFSGFVPITLLILLAVECGLRLSPYHMVRSDNIQMPASVSAIRSTKDWSEFKVLDTTIAITYGFNDPLDPNLPTEMKNMLSSMSGLTSTMWGLHSMDGALALPLGRHNILTQPMLDEIQGNSKLPPGLRLIDTLGIRYISTYGPAQDGLALRPLWHGIGAPWTLENSAALPRFQIYSDHVTVDSADAALAFMQHWARRTLVIENPVGADHRPEPQDMAPSNANPNVDARTPIQFAVSKATDTDYRLNLHASQAGWLFLADANYPGWKAYLDGKLVPVFSAQVLGKAVAIPEGEHDLEIRFEPASFRWGMSISIATLSLMLAVLTLMRARYHKTVSAERASAAS
jgi:hypothetical protein